ncbi:PREDICTED: muscle M-line assembly protein unc-89-like, partial [Rhagoletis zephyria]|uniref:muscle M-line assembly protein unc-89-like n=1 Tax=Rhagoletis zephyria TaxID=28612 RepID=UPI000811346C
MPLYTDQGYYYSGGSSQLYAPYYTPGLYAIPTSSSGGSYAPYSSTYNRTFGGSYILPLAPPRTPSYTTTHSLSSRYQPKLSTITETSPLISARHGGVLPLTRIQSPKVSSYSAPTTNAATKYVPPRPIAINTADIDVSSSRYTHHTHHEEEKEKEKEVQQDDPEVKHAEKRQGGDVDAQVEAQVEEHKVSRSTIKRDRPVVRLSTIRSRSKDRNRATKSTSSGTDESPEPKTKMFKDLPTIEPLHTTETHLSWRQKLADELAAVPKYPIKKSPGDLIRERYLIQDSATDELDLTLSRRTAPTVDDATEEQMSDQVVVEMDLDPASNSIRRLSIPQCPSFHDICEDISSDKIDDDLNAGELRRRASLIQEQEQEILNQLQNSPSGTFQLIHLERRESQDSTVEEGHRKSTKKRASKKGKKIRHKITAIVEVENAPLLPVLQEKEEPTPTPAGKERSPQPKFTFNVESMEEHHEIHKVFKLPKRKSVKKVSKPKEVVLPEGFMQASPKSKVAPKAKTPKKESFVSTAEIFTFEPISMELNTETEAHESKEKITSPTSESKAPKSNKSNESVMKIATPPPKTTPMTVLKPSLSVDPAAEKLNVNTSNRVTEKFQPPKCIDLNQQISPTNLKAATVKPLSTEKPKVIQKTLENIKSNPIEKSDSGEDFWAQIGKRESVYMTNRKKGQLENQWQKREELLDSQAVEDVSNIKEIKTAVTAQKKEALKKADQDISKINEKGVVGRSQSTESAICKKDNKDQKTLKEIGFVKPKTIPKESLDSAQKSPTEVQSKTEKATTSTINDPTFSTTAAKTTRITTATTTTVSPSATSAATKINFGQTAKSPEQQANKFTPQADNDNDNEQTKLFICQTGIASATSTATTTSAPTTIQTTATPKSVTASTDRNAKKTEKLATSTQLTESQVAGTSISATTTAKTVMQSASESKKTEVKTDKPKEAHTKADAAGKKNVACKSPPTSPIAPPSGSGIVSVAKGAKPKTVPKATTTK